MSHKHGAYLGGVRCLETLRDRCRVNPDTGCWHWSLAICNGQPRVHYIDPDTGKNVAARGRRAAVHLSSGRAPLPGIVCFARRDCKSDDCVNPAHARSGTPAEMGEHKRKAGRTKLSGPQLAALLKMVRTKRRTKLTMEKAREIRASELSCAELSRKHGVGASQISAVRNGKAWRETLRVASVFSLGSSA